jgi:hypothetical protein
MYLVLEQNQGDRVILSYKSIQVNGVGEKVRSTTALIYDGMSEAYIIAYRNEELDARNRWLLMWRVSERSDAMRRYTDFVQDLEADIDVDDIDKLIHASFDE